MTEPGLKVRQWNSRCVLTLPCSASLEACSVMALAASPMLPPRFYSLYAWTSTQVSLFSVPWRWFLHHYDLKMLCKKWTWVSTEHLKCKTLLRLNRIESYNLTRECHKTLTQWNNYITKKWGERMGEKTKCCHFLFFHSRKFICFTSN